MSSRPITISFLGLLASGMLLSTATAATIADGDTFRKAVRDAQRLTKEGDATCKEEQKMINAAFAEFRKKQMEDPNTVLGAAFIDANNLIFLNPVPGTAVTLTFDFLDVGTLLPSPGPPVASVLYEVDLTLDLIENYTLIGTSTDGASHFAVPWFIPPGEAIVRAIPLDTFGHLVQIPGDNGASVGIGLVCTLCPVPEPTTAEMASLGVLAAAVLHSLRLTIAAHSSARRNNGAWNT